MARLSLESLVGAEPRAITVTFDGRPLAAGDPRRIELPPYDERQLHFLRAELEFTDNLTSTAEFTFGGTYVDEINAELSAIPVRSQRRRKLPGRARFGALLALGGKPLEVAAAERSLAAPAQVRRYLSRLRVPFYVWSLSRPPGGEEWGEVRDVSSLSKLRRAADELARDLDRQWIAWVDGVHLPQDVALTPAAEASGLQLVE